MSESGIDLLESLEEARSLGVERLGRKVLALERLLTVGRKINTLDLETLLRLILDSLVEISGTRRAALLLADGEGGLTCELAVGLVAAEVESADFDHSRSLARRALATGEVQVVEAVAESAFAGTSSVAGLGLRAVLAIPLRHAGRTLGVLYADTDGGGHHLSEGDRSIFAGFGSQAAVALANARRHRTLEEECLLLRRSTSKASRHGGLIFRSRAMERLCRTLGQVADSEVTVLIQGETGTGKELVARALHRASRRRHRPLVVQNAGALPESLLESELFGHRRGAFTGAVESRLGLFEAAAGGTVFLDEIGEASPALQVRLLRLLEAGTVRRVGESRDRSCDVRILAATHRDLEREVAEGRFREDLFYRLSVLPLTVPPLRQRREDIPVLVHHFVEELNRELGKAVTQIPKSTLERLCDEPWPGNVRQLRNAVHRMMVLARGDALEEEAVPRLPLAASHPPATPEEPRTLEEVERDYIRHVLQHTGGNQSQAARLLGLKRSTLRWRMKKLGLLP